MPPVVFFVHYGFHIKCAQWFSKPKWVLPDLSKGADHPLLKTLKQVNQTSNTACSGSSYKRLDFHLFS